MKDLKETLQRDKEEAENDTDQTEWEVDNELVNEILKSVEE